ncbi:MAG: MarR family transcriptional regulator [Pseudomonadota bacterium]|nr:MarR family transcriptional regulator [Pseudomonadota bacterium]
MSEIRTQDPTPEAEALYELMIQLPQLNTAIRLTPFQSDQKAQLSGGIWTLLRSLKLNGPRSVPQIARLRGLARQRIQVLVDEAIERGFVRLRVNPEHKRSRIVALTRNGAAAFEQHDADSRRLAEELSGNMDIRDLDAALRVLFDLSENTRVIAR